MKALFFNAVAGHPKVAPPLMHQTRTTLRPFNQFLGQAIHTAKQRQTRFQLPWERVRDLATVWLTPMDTRLRVPRRAPEALLEGWPEAVTPDLGQPGFVINRGVPIQVRAATRTPGGLRIQTTPPVCPGDQLVWCAQQLPVSLEASSPAPRVVTDLDGEALQLLSVSPTPDEAHWLLCVEGVYEDRALLVDGEDVDAEALPSFEDLKRLRDSEGRSFDAKGTSLRLEELPAEGPLRGDDGLRYGWSAKGREGRSGNWVQLKPPERSEADETLDPRAAFCEGDVREVWTQPRHHHSAVFRVKRVDAERYQLLLDELPPEGSTLYLPVQVRNLHLQRRALRQLTDAPLPHHQGLLRLCEDPNHARWPPVSSAQVSGWRALTDETRSGTEQQRRFVQKALGTPDFAFLEGPPGSGKTTAICEIVQQLIRDGQRVLLCASTHVAIDNVLERLVNADDAVDAVRVGRVERVDDAVRETQLDERVDALVAAWRSAPALSSFGDHELAEMAERTLIMSANLTCGTTMGIVNHPVFRGRDSDLHVAERPISTMPHWDVLIIDEASKTLIQEFMVPALMAKRWIVVGDVRQLPPFADRADIVANLRDLVDSADKPVFPREHQRACLLRFRLRRRDLQDPSLRWLLVEPPGVLDCVERELAEAPEEGLSVIRISARAGEGRVSIQQLRDGAPEALHLAAAQWVLVGDDLLQEAAPWLPSSLLASRDLGAEGVGLGEDHPLLHRQAWWLDRFPRLPQPYRDRRSRQGDVTERADCQRCEADWLSRNDLAQELAWRITRLHELRHSRKPHERERLRRDLTRLLPHAADITGPLGEIEDIGLPSILQVLQEGIGEARSSRPSALTAGLRATRGGVLDARFESLRFQHRMHPEISAFPREVIYSGQALEDANTIEQRDRALGWSFGPLRSRSAWAHVRGRESGGVNADEVREVEAILRRFLRWAREVGPPKRGGVPRWEVACLSFYVKQERALSQMLQSLTGDPRKTRFQAPGIPVEIVCGTVDRFQGREADLVLLSMRNTRRVGFLDSPNRLNVAVTRARQQLIVVGEAEYFARCGVSELEELSKRCARAPTQSVKTQPTTTPRGAR